MTKNTTTAQRVLKSPSITESLTQKLGKASSASISGTGNRLVSHFHGDGLRLKS